jgi:alpha-glucuronidase
MVGRFTVVWAALVMALFSLPGIAHADDGYDLWLRYRPLAEEQRTQLMRDFSELSLPENPTERTKMAADELQRAFAGMTGETLPVAMTSSRGTILIGTPSTSQAVASLNLALNSLGAEGYIVRSILIDGAPATVVAANSDLGTLYGTFALLRHIQSGKETGKIDIVSRPKIQLRLLNHWDNLDRHVERGYAGQSLWDYWKLPDYRDPRYTDYARANASLGINGTVINNVNAKADSLAAPYIAKAAALADVFRPYGIRVYLSARFSAPIEIGGLKTADPHDPEVRAWWAKKVDEIYVTIPDFGGFLVKANSEGQPGPQDYKRTHADGANMLADALRPHGGTVMWRAFVYQQENPDDRAKQAYADFKPLDGKFADNVLVQVKNGPIDFQPREPFHPLFGAMPKTPLMMEFQITKEYLGFATHLAYLAPLYEEVLDTDTLAKGKGSTVSRIIDGGVDGHTRSGIAGVANIGSDRNWSGSHFDQANWYAFGRLAWDHWLSSADIAREWAGMTFTTDSRFVEPAVAMMMRSREAVVDYMTPLGLAHLMATGHHYGPGPWVSDLARPEWNPTYYHRADKDGIGFDRTKTGSNAVAQYAPDIAKTFADIKRVDERDLLWFHHVRWDHKMKSGKTLWAELIGHYDRGVADVADMQTDWAKLSPYVDSQRHKDVTDFLKIQQQEAHWWRDASIAYFSSVSGLPLPARVRAPERDLEYYKRINFPYAPGN